MAYPSSEGGPYADNIGIVLYNLEGRRVWDQNVAERGEVFNDKDIPFFGKNQRLIGGNLVTSLYCC